MPKGGRCWVLLGDEVKCNLQLVTEINKTIKAMRTVLVTSR